MKLKIKKNIKPSWACIFDILKVRKIWKYIISILLIAISSLLLVFYGASLQRDQTMSKIQNIVFNAVETKFSVLSNYLSGLTSSPTKIYIDAGFKEIQLLNYARESALSKGVITNEEQQVSVKASITVADKIFKVKLSPTGQN